MGDPEPLHLERYKDEDRTDRIVWPDPLPRHIHVVRALYDEFPEVREHLEAKGYGVEHDYPKQHDIGMTLGAGDG